MNGKARSARQCFADSAPAEDRKRHAFERNLLDRAKANRLPRKETVDEWMAKIAFVGGFGRFCCAVTAIKKGSSNSGPSKLKGRRG
jgi:hypothetical protein